MSGEAVSPAERTDGCPSAEDIQAFVERRLEVPVHDRIVRHVDRCPACREWVTELASLGVAAETLGGPEVEASSHLGRYQVAEEIGRGAMGVVYTAHDPQLGRDVALKLIEYTGSDVRARALREARAMARVHHPNVVGVLDFGSDAEVFFVVMELVRGQTLRAWQRESRPWQDVVRAYLQAAQGLSAAHHCGVVHRDFKPANVLVGEDGSVRVTDFGLARGPGCQVEITASSHHDVPDITRTTTGALIGTMAYMAPEQLRGEGATARSDQFALCVALWEGLSGQRPFDGATAEELLDAIRRGPPPDIAPGVPSSVAAVLKRGLELEASHRYGSVDDLIAALAVASKPRRRSARTLAVGVGLSIVVAVSLLHPGLQPNPAPQELDAREASAQVPYVDPAVEKELRQRLDGIRDAARENRLDGLGDACGKLQAEVDALDDPSLRAEVQVVCSDVDLGNGDLAAANEKLEAAYFQARAAGSDAVALEASTRRLLVALFEQGDYAMAERWLAHAQAELERSESPRMHALVARAAASLWAYHGDYDLAFDAVERGAEAARSGGLEPLEIILREEQANLLRAQQRHDEALVLYRQLERRIDALDDDPLDTLGVRIGLGRTLLEAGRFDDALSELDRVMSILERAQEHGERVWAAEVTDLRGDALRHLGRLTEARAAELDCLSALEGTGAAFIPIALNCQTEVFAIDALLGRCEAISLDLGRHLDTVSHRLGPHHPDTAHARVWSGYCGLVLGEIDHGLAELQMVLESFADTPRVPSARLARALVAAQHWGLPAASALD